jgi:DNA-binding CsgD family transcriptional regulator
VGEFTGSAVIVKSQKGISELIGDIYQAAAMPEHWEVFLDKLTGVAEATAGAILLTDQRRYEVAFHRGLDGLANQSSEEDRGQIDMFGRNLFRFGLRDWIGGGPGFAPGADLSESRFYNDYLRELDLYYQCGTSIGTNDSHQAVLIMLRARRRGPFEESHRELLCVLESHLIRALQLHARLLDLQLEASGLGAAVDASGLGIVFLNDRGEVSRLNRVAEALIAQGDGLHYRDRQLSAGLRRESLQLQTAIKGAVATATERGSHSSCAMLITRSSGKPLQVIVSPFGSTRPFGMATPSCFLVFIADPDRKLPPIEALLGTLYGLTPAEARLVMLLTEGETISRAAEKRHITVGTARFALKSVFRKTRTSRQSELLKLVMALPVLRSSEGLVLPDAVPDIRKAGA